jgi:hypothetical protein
MRMDSFCGPSYDGRSRIVDGENCVNLYCENIESGQGKNAKYSLNGCPGKVKLMTLPDAPVRGLWSGPGFDGIFCVSGGTVYQLFPGQPTPYVKLGNVNNSQDPAQMFANSRTAPDTDLFIVSGGQGYDLRDGVITSEIPASTGTYIDTYFVAGQPNTAQFNISGNNDGQSWDPLDFALKSGSPDPISSVFAAYDLLWLFGFQTTEVWYDSGAANFPFQRIQGAFFQVGLVAPFSVTQVGNTVMWLGGDVRGSGVVYQAQGYSFPTRVSNHAIEYWINEYKTKTAQGMPNPNGIQDAVAYSYQEGGHTFYVLTFPSADATWVYDLTTGLWHRRGFWDAATGILHADRQWVYCYGFNMHLVGDRSNGNIYESSINYFTDYNAVLRRSRRFPHLNVENKRNRFGNLEIDLQKGVVPSSQPGLIPQMMARHSNDGGFTWSSEEWQSIGAGGEYGQRVIFRRQGSARDRVFEVAFTDATDLVMVNAYIEVVQGTG